MVERDHIIEQEIDERTSKPMEWQQVLFLQVNRINDAMTRMEGSFLAGIEALDMDLAYFQDKTYDKEMAELNKRATEWLSTQKQVGGYIPSNSALSAQYARAKEHMKILLRLVGRSGFYPESQGTWKGKR